jgi:putative membrane protein
MFVVVIYLASLFLGVQIIPSYVLLAVVVIPYVSYISEVYIVSRKIRYGGIIAGGVTFFFFYLLFPVITKQVGSLLEVLTAIGEFMAAVFLTVVAVYIARRVLER